MFNFFLCEIWLWLYSDFCCCLYLSFVLIILLLYLGEHAQLWWSLTRLWCYTCNHIRSVKSLSNHCCMIALCCVTNVTHWKQCVELFVLNINWPQLVIVNSFIVGIYDILQLSTKKALYTFDSLQFSTPAHFSWTMYKLITTGHRQLILIQKK